MVFKRTNNVPEVVLENINTSSSFFLLVVEMAEMTIVEMLNATKKFK